MDTAADGRVDFDFEIGRWQGAATEAVASVARLERVYGRGAFYAFEPIDGRHVYTRFLWLDVLQLHRWEQAFPPMAEGLGNELDQDPPAYRSNRRRAPAGVRSHSFAQSRESLSVSPPRSPSCDVSTPDDLGN
jgi:hypothetical protein